MSERMPVLEFDVPGIPRPEGVTSPGHLGGDAYGRLIEWRNSVAVLARAARRGRWAPVVPPETVMVFASFRIPATKSGQWAGASQPGGPPDLDKLQRAVGDAMQTAGVYLDDAQIVSWHATKSFADDSRKAGVHVRVLVAHGGDR